jgi:hypothetical protein
MDANYIGELLIKAEGLKADGQAYEDLFTNVQKLKNSSFKKIKPYGRYGDRKNDGFIVDSGTYFQVFAPENIKNSRTIVKAVEKLEEDFNGLYSHWGQTSTILHFKYVVNDKQKGCPAPVEQKLIELKVKFPLIEFTSYTLDDLILDFNSLTLNQKYSVVGYIPSFDNLTTISIPAISDTIEHLKNIASDFKEVTETLDQEELHSKIKFNNLGESIKELIEKAETQSYLIEDYFSSNQNKQLKTLVRDNLNYIYQKEKRNNGEFDLLTGAASFFAILNKISSDRSKESMNSSLVLMSYFFISCDIYEKPITII